MNSKPATKEAQPPDGVANVHGGDVLGAAARYGVAPGEILDFSANLVPLGTPAGVLAAVTQALASVRRYPEPYSRAAARRIAEWRRVPPDAVLVGNGAAEVIHLLGQLFQRRRALIPVPAFAEYARSVIASGGEVIEYPLPQAAGFVPDLSELETAVRAHGADWLFLCNPHNPTGVLLDREAVLRLAARVSEFGAWVVVDEAFIDLVDDPWARTAASAAAASEAALGPRLNLLVIGSLTKLFGLPGLRLGYLVGNPEVIRRVNALRDPWSVGVPAQAAVEPALDDLAYLQAVRHWLPRERAFLFQGLAGLPGLRPCPPAANFVLVEAGGTGLSAAELQSRLGPGGIVIRDCANFANLGPHYFRVAVRDRADNQRLLEALAAALEPGGSP